MRKGSDKKKKENKKNRAERLKTLKEKKERLLYSFDDDVMKCDYKIVVTVLMLTAFGVLMVLSAGYYSTINSVNPDPYLYLKKQGAYAVAGIAIMFFVAKLDYHKYMKYANFCLVISIVLLCLLFTPLGLEVNNAVRWIHIVGGINITPSEISKLAMIIFTSAFYAKDPGRIHDMLGGVLPMLVIMGIHALLIIKQPNLSTAIVVSLIIMGIMFVAGLDLKLIGAMFALIVAGLAGILILKPSNHWYARLTTWTDPFAYQQGDGYQVSQGLIALGNGGIKGLGLGNSVAKNLYLPEPQNDFILAIIGEELGFIGILILMCVYIYLIWRCLIVANRAKDKFGFYLASGVAIMLALQVIINVAVVTSSMPATGITLPFISYGGTSIIVFAAAMGIVLNISKNNSKKEGI